MYARIIKPMFDILASLILFLILSPLFFVTLVCLTLSNSGQPFFYQKRPGKDGRLFRIIKFKTMNDKKDENGQLLPDELRLTWIGKTVRKLSLDEIPQLLNVIRGQMSLVGPRPLLVEYLPLYNEKQARRHEVRPGITGWAQVNGRNTLTWEKKFEYDVWYVDHISLALDIKIFLLTILKVFRSEGISSATSATMEKFTGTK